MDIEIQIKLFIVAALEFTYFIFSGLAITFIQLKLSVDKACGSEMHVKAEIRFLDEICELGSPRYFLHLWVQFYI